jgi:hypothetical protein
MRILGVSVFCLTASLSLQNQLTRMFWQMADLIP